MGEAERGISEDDMRIVRAMIGNNIAIFNERRRDSHGEHPFMALCLFLQIKRVSLWPHIWLGVVIFHINLILVKGR